MSFRKSNALSLQAAPLHPAIRGPYRTLAIDDRSGAGSSAEQAGRILIVEDDFLVAAEVEAALLSAGFQVAGIADSAEQAMAIASAERPALAIMDIRLAGKRDGIEAAIELYKKFRIPSIFATAHSDEFTRSRAAPSQPLGWLQKPYSMPSMIEMVERAIEQIRNDK